MRYSLVANDNANGYSGSLQFSYSSSWKTGALVKKIMLHTTSVLLLESNSSMIDVMFNKRKILIIIGVAVAIIISVYTGLFGMGV
jgi:hypothetical protein